MLTTALLPLLSAPLEPMHAQYVPALTDIAPLLLIRELPQDEYPTPALPMPFTSHDVEPVMFGHEISSEMPLFLPWRPLCLAQETLVAERLRFFWLRGDVYRDSGFSRTVDHERAPLVHDTSSCV